MRGSIAKEKVTDVISKAFGKDFVGIVDKKIYVQAEEDGEMVQVAITMTCPKNPISAGGEDGLDFTSAATPAGEPSVFQPAEITTEELDNVKKMLKELGL